MGYEQKVADESDTDRMVETEKRGIGRDNKQQGMKKKT